MEQRYKEALQHLYKQRFNASSEHLNYPCELFDLRTQYFLSPNANESSRDNNEQDKLHRESKSQVTEKTLILDSLHQFGKEKLEENKQSPVSIEGGQIRYKETGSNQQTMTNSFEIEPVEDNFEAFLLKSLGELNIKARFANKALDLNQNSELKVIFITDCFQNEFELEPKELSEFNALFEPHIAQLFSKMIKAMKLDKDDFILTAVQDLRVDKVTSCLDTVLQELYHFKPQLIIPLGVTASHTLLEVNKRLKEIHGKFYQLQINDFSTQVMPLFSPNLLNTAVNMKKIAWEDMQKAMKHLNL